MNKILQIGLISAIMATSGFASIADFQGGGVVNVGSSIIFEGANLDLATDKVLDVYGSLTGSGTIECEGGAKVNVYDGEGYMEDLTNKDAITGANAITDISKVHTFNEIKTGSISDDIKVDPTNALIKPESNLATYGKGLTATDLIYIANSDGAATQCIGEDDSATTIPANLANNDAGIETLTPSALVLEKKLKFSGDNSQFTGKTVTIGGDNPGEVEYATAKSAFQVATTVEGGSSLTISDATGMSLKNDLTVNGSTEVLIADPSITVAKKPGSLIVKGKLIVEGGTTLTLKSTTNAVLADYTYNYPTVMTWPEETFKNTMTESDTGDGVTVTFSDGVFSYNKDGSNNHVRVCQNIWDDNWAMFKIDKISSGTYVIGPTESEQHYFFEVTRTTGNLKFVITDTSNSEQANGDIKLEGKNKIYCDSDSYYLNFTTVAREFFDAVTSPNDYSFNITLTEDIE